MEEESNGELALLETLLKRNNGEISVLVFRKPTHTNQYLHYSDHFCVRKGLLSNYFNLSNYLILRNFF